MDDSFEGGYWRGVRKRESGSDSESREVVVEVAVAVVVVVVAEVEVVLYLYVPNPVRISLKGRRLIWLMEIGDLLGAGEDFKLQMPPR